MWGWGADARLRKRPHGLKATTTLLGGRSECACPPLVPALGQHLTSPPGRHSAPQAAGPLPKRRLPRPKPHEKRQKLPLDTSAPFCHYPAMLGETQKPILPHPRSAKYGRACKKQIPMCSLRSLTCLRVQVLPRQWMVGPSSHSRLWLEETPTGASSAVNGRASRRCKLPARTGQPL